jgi:hypothetical protein
LGDATFWLLVGVVELEFEASLFASFFMTYKHWKSVIMILYYSHLIYS